MQTKLRSFAVLVVGTVATFTANVSMAAITYPEASTLYDSGNGKIEGYIEAALPISAALTLAYAVWRHMKKAGNKL